MMAKTGMTLTEPAELGGLKAARLMRRQSTNSIRARRNHLIFHLKAGYMCASYLIATSSTKSPAIVEKRKLALFRASRVATLPTPLPNARPLPLAVPLNAGPSWRGLRGRENKYNSS